MEMNTVYVVVDRSTLLMARQEFVVLLGVDEDGKYFLPMNNSYVENHKVEINEADVVLPSASALVLPPTYRFKIINSDFNTAKPQPLPHNGRINLNFARFINMGAYAYGNDVMFFYYKEPGQLIFPTPNVVSQDTTQRDDGGFEVKTTCTYLPGQIPGNKYYIDIKDLFKNRVYIKEDDTASLTDTFAFIYNRENMCLDVKVLSNSVNSIENDSPITDTIFDKVESALINLKSSRKPLNTPE
jgi:hypothetical protein